MMSAEKYRPLEVIVTLAACPEGDRYEQHRVRQGNQDALEGHPRRYPQRAPVVRFRNGCARWRSRIRFFLPCKSSEYRVITRAGGHGAVKLQDESSPKAGWFS